VDLFYVNVIDFVKFKVFDIVGFVLFLVGFVGSKFYNVFLWVFGINEVLKNKDNVWKFI